ncbi:MAG: hypothetical protein CM1200mP40_23400 [Gammaproteobacteria bacterium]|nr:MAG: hypothetical protein CM1200mP40_23400 [Gammaproteobacteria bacterium]
MLVAGHAQGVGAMWGRVDGLSPYRNERTRTTRQETIIGFLYIGTINGPLKTLNKTPYR